MFEDLDPLACSSSELLAWLDGLEPGVLALSMLVSVNASALSPQDAVTYVQVHERIGSWWASRQVDAVIAAASPMPRVEEFALLVRGTDEEVLIRVEDAIREELGSATRQSPATAQHRIDAARLLAGPLADTHLALALGEITTGHVAVVVEHACRLPGRWMRDDTEREAFTHGCRELERRVLPVAKRGTLAATRAAAKRAVLAIDAEGERRRRQEARCTRDVWVRDEVDGISMLFARMATEQAHAVMTVIDATAHATAHARDDRLEVDPAATIGERRVQALAGLVLGGDDATATGGVVRAHLDLVIDLPTFLALADGIGGTGGTGQVELRGAGPLPATVLADLLADPHVAVTMRRLVTDPLTGRLLDYGRRTYEVPQALRDFIVARDRTCRFPGCRRSAARCQVDHAIAWDDGGTTSPANLGALCVRHHQLKTLGGWDITDSRSDGSCAWRSPHGRQYEHSPPTH
jgi:hypothetical protein